MQLDGFSGIMGLLVLALLLFVAYRLGKAGKFG